MFVWSGRTVEARRETQSWEEQVIAQSITGSLQRRVVAFVRGEQGKPSVQWHGDDDPPWRHIEQRQPVQSSDGFHDDHGQIRAQRDQPGLVRQAIQDLAVRPVEGWDPGLERFTQVEDSDSDVNPELLHALESDLSVTVAFKRRARVFIEGNSPVPVSRGRFQGLSSDDEFEESQEFDMTVADSVEEVETVIEPTALTQWESGVEFSLVRGSGFPKESPEWIPTTVSMMWRDPSYVVWCWCRVRCGQSIVASRITSVSVGQTEVCRLGVTTETGCPMSREKKRSFSHTGHPTHMVRMQQKCRSLSPTGVRSMLFSEISISGIKRRFSRAEPTS